MLRIPVGRMKNVTSINPLTSDQKVFVQGGLKATTLKMVIIGEFSYKDEVLFSQIESRLRDMQIHYTALL